MENKDIEKEVAKLRELEKELEQAKGQRDFYREKYLKFCSIGESVEKNILEANDRLSVQNEKFREELEEREAYIVANPCAQCGGKINAKKAEAWSEKARQLEKKLEIATKALNYINASDSAMQSSSKARETLKEMCSKDFIDEELSK